jgi:hypothetical protein
MQLHLSARLFNNAQMAERRAELAAHEMRKPRENLPQEISSHFKAGCWLTQTSDLEHVSHPQADRTDCTNHELDPHYLKYILFSPEFLKTLTVLKSVII